MPYRSSKRSRKEARTLSTTLEQIARAAGTSVSTASRALHNSNYAVSDSTRQRIVQLAKDMGYRPNLAARGLRGKTTNVVGIVVENVSDPFSSQIVRGVIDELKLADFSSIIINTDYDPLAEREAVQTLVSNRTDGIIFVQASIHSDSSLTDLAGDVPHVSIARIQPPADNMVGLDDYYGAQLAVDHLVGLGRRRIAFIGGPEHWWSTRERLAGYLNALKLGNIPPAPRLYMQHGDWEAESGRVAASALLDLDDPPDAIFAANDLMAQGAIYAIQDAGLIVPRDIAIVGHDDREFAQVVRPALTTVRLPSYEMGQAAVAMFRRRLEGDGPIPAQLVRGELIVRESCGGVGPRAVSGRSETRVGRDAVPLEPAGNLVVRPLPNSAVQIDGGFWGDRQDLNRRVLLPALYEQLQTTGAIQALGLAWKPGMPGAPRPTTESELAQWIEAACLSIAASNDPELSGRVDELVDLFVRAQHPDGYVNAFYTVVEPGRRFTDLRNKGELTSAGHILRAARAHHSATGEYRFLNVALRYADLIGSILGSGEHQMHGYPGDPGFESALVDHFRSTGERRYLELGRYFVHQRGLQPSYFEQEARDRGDAPSLTPDADARYSQAHGPVWQQSVAVGHAARASRLYAAMADIAIETDDESLWHAMSKLNGSVTDRRMYVTGGIGSTRLTQAFTDDFDLPNETASASTEAAVALFDWFARMATIELDGRHADLVERVLYNGLLVGLGLDGDHVFDLNVLAARRARTLLPSEQLRRRPVTSPDPAAVGLARIMASLGSVAYAQSDDVLVVSHYLSSTAHFQVGTTDVELRQSTAYPWDGDISIHLDVASPMEIEFRMRLPGWCASSELRINGVTVPAPVEAGHLVVRRTWQLGDKIDLRLAMPVQRLYAHPAVSADRGRIALQRGPIVYCIEEADNGPNLDSFVIPRDAPIEAVAHDDLLGGVVALHIDGQREGQDAVDKPAVPYSTAAPPMSASRITAVPYFAWDNRLAGDMQVWIRETR